MPPVRYRSLVDEISACIHRGELRPGDRLPTVRALMQQHGIALATASRVMAELAAAGLVVGEVGRGTFVRDASLPRGSRLEQHPAGAGAGVIDLTFSYPTLPGQDGMLREGLRSLAASGDLDALLHAAPQGGRLHERQTLARHLRNRGIRMPAEQVLIVNGAQQGLAVTVMALLRPGDAIVMDALTYPGMLALARAHRLDILALPQVAGQADLDALARLCKRRPVRAIYTMPTMHNPLGSVMPEAARMQLVVLAERHDVLIIEDATYAFLAEPAPTPLVKLAPQRTIYVSGLSKSVAAGLRVGLVAAPATMIARIEQAIRISTWQAPSVTTALACLWIASGRVDALEDDKRADARRRQALARRLLRGCPFTAHPSSYYLWLPLAGGQRADQVAAALKQDGVLVSTAEAFAATTHVPQALRVALGSVEPEALSRALRKVRLAASA
ncbi:PLP-dependent aminotransferase family protein [Aquabacterium sp.]|uniref:aminotransferase-like domain-containing protein n=1 Tax=Aquabacterium sp. TaxID=1872578 RepID=UPI002C4CD25A|nr:PLP-dependent aminotransferase family protein [Aquabacterium sp.]HSW04230.1 PLP-dependent aminotransferase family protein [Aquabacterium sp.]